MSGLGDFLPVRSGPARRRPGSRPRAVTVSLGVVAPASVLPALACAAGVVLARRGRASQALVCLYSGVEPAVAPPRAARDALAVSLARRDLVAHRHGRLLVVALPAGAADAARAAGLAAAAARDVPFVLGLALRTGPHDALLAAQDAVIMTPPADAGLAELAAASMRSVAPVCGRADAVRGPVARALAIGGVAAPRSTHRTIAEVLT